MRVQRYPAPDRAEAEQLSYEATAIALERALWGTFEVEMTTFMGSEPVDHQTQAAQAGSGYLSDVRAAMADGLHIEIVFSHSLPLPRLPHEYRAWLA